MAEGGKKDNLVDEIRNIQEEHGNHQLHYTSEEVEIGSLKAGDHLAVKHSHFFYSYYHHGIFLSHTEGVVDFGGQNLSEMKIEKVDLARFMKNCTLMRINYPTKTCLEAEATVAHAAEVLQTPDLWGPYDTMRNNCEHFAIKCKTGLSDVSPQVLKEIEACLNNPIKRLVLRKSKGLLQILGIR